MLRITLLKFITYHSIMHGLKFFPNNDVKYNFLLIYVLTNISNDKSYIGLIWLVKSKYKCEKIKVDKTRYL